MKAALTRFKRFALRPLWTEDETYRARRRCRTWLATPFATLAGVAWGAMSAPAIGAGSQMLWGALGGFSFAFFMYLEQLLVPPLARLAAKISAGSGMLAVLFWEAAVVGGLVFLLTRVLGAPFVPAVGTALGVGAFYAVVMEYFVCGTAAADLVSVLQASRGGTPLPEQYSHAKTMVERGRYDDAIAVYEKAISEHPREGMIYAHLSRAHSRKGDHESAVAALRRGFLKASLTPEQEGFFVRQIHEICTSKLGDPVRAVEDIRLFLSHEPEGGHAEWALKELAEIEAGFLPQMGPPGGEDDIHEAAEPGEVERFDQGAAAEDAEGAPPVEADTVQRLEVSDDFSVEEGYSLGDELVTEEGIARDELYASAWSEPDAPVDDATPIPSAEADDNPDDEAERPPDAEG